jgi:predicted phosphodiesterase
MRIAVFSDIHGNLIALQTLLGHLQSESVDAIYCLGDLFTPYPGSREIWDLINTYQVQCVLGNTEAALLAYDQGTQDYTSDETRFRPFLKNAQEVAGLLPVLQAIPAYRVVSLGNVTDLHFCHYSPEVVYRGLHSTFQLTLDEYVQRLPEPIVITGHLHAFPARDIGGKQVYTVGSAGLPLKGAHQLEYAIVKATEGEFEISHHLLPYKVINEVNYLLAQGFMQDYGPIAWLAFDEILTQRDRITGFFKDFLPSQKPQLRDWYRLVEIYLRSIGRWETISGYMGDNQ